MDADSRIHMAESELRHRIAKPLNRADDRAGHHRCKDGANCQSKKDDHNGLPIGLFLYCLDAATVVLSCPLSFIRQFLHSLRKFAANLWLETSWTNSSSA